ncbi:MAG: hypothetical protein SFZ02_17085 [bacterium]|nr:hypothetical protein [bacterium]
MHIALKLISFPLKLLYHLLLDPAYRERIAYGTFGVDGYSVNKKRLWIPIFGGGLSARDGSQVIIGGGDGGGRIQRAGDDDRLAGGGGGSVSIGMSGKIGKLHIMPFMMIGGEGGGIAQISHEALKNKSVTKADIHGSAGGGGLMNGAGVRVDYRIGNTFGVLIGVQVGYRGVLIGGIRLPRPFIQGVVGFGKFDGVI